MLFQLCNSCLTDACPSPNHQVSGRYACKTAATHARETTASEHCGGSVLRPRQVRYFILVCFLFVPLTPHWCCGAVVGQRLPVKASGASLYGHSRQQMAAGHVDTYVAKHDDKLRSQNYTACKCNGSTATTVRSLNQLLLEMVDGSAGM